MYVFELPEAAKVLLTRLKREVHPAAKFKKSLKASTPVRTDRYIVRNATEKPHSRVKAWQRGPSRHVSSSIYTLLTSSADQEEGRRGRSRCRDQAGRIGALASLSIEGELTPVAEPGPQGALALRTFERKLTRPQKASELQGVEPNSTSNGDAKKDDEAEQAEEPAAAAEEPAAEKPNDAEVDAKKGGKKATAAGSKRKAPARQTKGKKVSYDEDVRLLLFPACCRKSLTRVQDEEPSEEEPSEASEPEEESVRPLALGCHVPQRNQRRTGRRLWQAEQEGQEVAQEKARRQEGRSRYSRQVDDISPITSKRSCLSVLVEHRYQLNSLLLHVQTQIVSSLTLRAYSPPSLLLLRKRSLSPRKPFRRLPSHQGPPHLSIHPADEIVDQQDRKRSS